MTDPPPWTSMADGVRLTVKATPRARRSACAGIVPIAEGKTALAIRLAAPPVDGAANDALTAFLARQLGIARSAVTITSRAGARIKHLQIAGNAAVIAQRLSAMAGSVEAKA